MYLISFRSFFIALTLSGLSFIPMAAFAGDDGQQSVIGAFVSKFTGADDLLDSAPPIIYHERAPLVMPPKGATNAELPAPSDVPSARTAAWPKDPDVKRAKTPQAPYEASDKLTNEELAKGKVAAQDAKEAVPVADCDNPSRGCGDPRAIWDPLKHKKANDDVAGLQPGVERPRDYLTQPPRGFLMPNKAANYTFDAPSKNFGDSSTVQASDYYREQAAKGAE